MEHSRRGELSNLGDLYTLNDDNCCKRSLNARRYFSGGDEMSGVQLLQVDVAVQ